MNKKRRHRILYFIQLPPPVHGVSIINKIVYTSKTINKGFEKKLIRINFSKDIEELRRFSIKKTGIFIKTYFSLIRALMKFRPDIIYFSLIPVGPGFLRDAIYALTMKIFKTNIVFHLNNRGIPEYNKKILYRFLYKKVFNNSTIIHVSKSLMSREIDILNLKNIRKYVVPNTIEDFTIHRKRNHPKKVNLLFLSNYFPEKGLMTLLEAIVLLKEKTNNFFLNTYGAIQNREEYQKYLDFVQKNKLNDYVKIHGPVYGKEKIKILEEADIFVFPSYFSEECFPLSILEAMNAKLSIIVSNIGAIPEMLKDNFHGLFFLPKDSRILTKKIELLLINEKLRKNMGYFAYTQFKKYFSCQIFIDNMNLIFNNFLAKDK